MLIPNQGLHNIVLMNFILSPLLIALAGPLKSFLFNWSIHLKSSLLNLTSLPDREELIIQGLQTVYIWEMSDIN